VLTHFVASKFQHYCFGARFVSIPQSHFHSNANIIKLSQTQQAKIYKRVYILYASGTPIPQLLCCLIWVLLVLPTLVLPYLCTLLTKLSHHECI